MGSDGQTHISISRAFVGAKNCVKNWDTHLDKAGVDVDQLHPAVALDVLRQDGVHSTVPLSQGRIRASAG